jgi:hypothetical protein
VLKPPSRALVRQRLKRFLDRMEVQGWDFEEFGPEWHELVELWMWREDRTSMLERHAMETEAIRAIVDEIKERQREVEEQKQKLDQEFAQWVRDKLG